MTTTAPEGLLERAERLYRDWRLGAVHEWKARTGGLAVGFMPVYAPREVLHAMGVLPVGLMGAGDDLEIIRGDAYYQSYICHIPEHHGDGAQRQLRLPRRDVVPGDL